MLLYENFHLNASGFCEVRPFSAVFSRSYSSNVNVNEIR